MYGEKRLLHQLRMSLILHRKESQSLRTICLKSWKTNSWDAVNAGIAKGRADEKQLEDDRKKLEGVNLHKPGSFLSDDYGASDIGDGGNHGF